MHASWNAVGASRLALAPGEYVAHAGESGPLCQVISGVLCLQEEQVRGRVIVQLAGAGDFVGVERLCDHAYRFSAKALTPSELLRCEPLLLGAEEVFSAHVLRQQQRALDMARLRTGAIGERLSHLLQILGIDPKAVAARQLLPTLRELGAIVDAAPATVCRELNRFMPPLAAPPHLRARAFEALRA